MATGSKYVVIGLGQFGEAIARNLSAKGVEVLAIDNNENHIEAIKDDVAMAVTMDATDIRALRTQNIQEADAVVMAIGEDFEALLLSTVYVQELGAKRVIARAHGRQQRMILEKIGVEEILSPEDEVAKVVTEQLLNPSVLSFLELPDDYEIVEIKAPQGIINKAVGEINLRNKYKINLVTIKRSYEKTKDGKATIEEHILGVPTTETMIYDTDSIVVFGLIKDIERFIDIN
ncbi:MAG: TrkA family potassium uptake protein [Flavobacteriales bacterium]|jgi:trk system potassium uptake protein|nr:TrkA family potassium uptake protein [Flavobacteriales bacterium]MBT6745222.1 TrkA family potassium uptake protein [Flavobacteriales bacterium]